MAHTRWCRSMAGEEFARVYSWGHDPKHKVRRSALVTSLLCCALSLLSWRQGDYEAASPCRHVDLPQTLLEPILTKRAVHQGWSLRFNTKLLRLTRPSPETVISEVLDEVTNRTYKIQSRYLFGCDGARSTVVRELGIPLIKKPGQGLALNVLVRADLSHLIANRIGNLHWVFRPEETEHPPWGWAAVVRMVRPWDEWMFIFLPVPGAVLTADAMDASDEEYLARVREFIGDDSVGVELLHVSKWWINEIVAEYYSDGNVYVSPHFCIRIAEAIRSLVAAISDIDLSCSFCFGDATHRHPPFNGLGSNTCIQDAFNLAWKIDYVMSGKAGPALLDSFSKERQPVGADVITRANQGLRDHIHWQQTMGMLEPDPARRREILAEFDDPGEKGRMRRQAFQEAIENTTTEFHGLGIEMNQRYESNAIYLDDQGSPPPLPDDLIKTYQVTTYPGRRLPHAWLNTRSPRKPISTIDLAGHGRFCLLTGPSGHAWKDAVKVVSTRLGVEIVSYSIGWKQDYEDVYFDWAKRREVGEDGCVLARPDRFIAWRSVAMIPNPAEKLEEVMRRILAL